jgi:hypothetical protein
MEKLKVIFGNALEGWLGMMPAVTIVLDSETWRFSSLLFFSFLFSCLILAWLKWHPHGVLPPTTGGGFPLRRVH